MWVSETKTTFSSNAIAGHFSVSVTEISTGELSMFSNLVSSLNVVREIAGLDSEAAAKVHLTG
jgi:hypothetical protein